MKNRNLVGNNAGLVTTTAGNDVVHTILYPRSAFLRKIMWSNRTGVNGTLIFGTMDAQAVPVFVPLLPTIGALTGFTDRLTEVEIPDVEWRLDRAILAAGRSGNIIVLASIAGILVRCTVEEKG